MVAGLKALMTRALNCDRERNRTDRTGSSPPAARTVSSPCTTMGAAKTDSLLLSEPLKALRDRGIELESSTVTQAAQMFRFNLQYQDEHIQTVSSNGTFDFRSQSLEIDLSFTSVLSVTDEATGEERQELFQFDLHLEASRVQSTRGAERTEKEDILLFARKILGKISKLYREGKEIDGLVLENDDLRDLGSVDEGRLLKSIMQMVDLLRTIDRLSGKNGDHVWVKPERETTRAAEATRAEEQTTRMSLSVRRLSMETLRSGGPSAGSAAASATSGSTPAEPTQEGGTTAGDEEAV